jgi:hypothetical protein
MRKSWEHVQSWKSSNNKDCNIAMTELGGKKNFQEVGELRCFERIKALRPDVSRLLDEDCY